MSWCCLLLILTSLLPAESNAVQGQQTRQNWSSEVSLPALKGIAEGFVESTIKQLVESSQQLEELKTKLSAVEGLTKQLTENNEQVGELRGKCTIKQLVESSQQLEELKTKLSVVEGLTKQLTESNEQVGELRGEFGSLQEEFDSLQEEHSLLKMMYQKLENHHALLQQEHSSLTTRFNSSIKDVAFNAYHSSDPFSPAGHSIIVYNTVTVNNGHGYDKLSGIFTAPVSGTYSFFTNCMAEESRDLYTEMMANGIRIASCYSHKIGGQAYELAATHGVAHLNAGEKAWVVMQMNTQNIRGNQWAAFSGFLIRANV